MSKEELFFDFYERELFGKELSFEKVSEANYILYGEHLKDRCLSCITKVISHLSSVYVSLMPLYKNKVKDEIKENTTISPVIKRRRR